MENEDDQAARAERAKRLRGQIRKIVTRDDPNVPSEATSDSSQPMSPHERIERRMQEL